MSNDYNVKVKWSKVILRGLNNDQSQTQKDKMSVWSNDQKSSTVVRGQTVKWSRSKCQNVSTVKWSKSSSQKSESNGRKSKSKGLG